MKKFYVTEVTSCLDCPNVDGDYWQIVRCMKYGTKSLEGKERIPDNCQQKWCVYPNNAKYPYLIQEGGKDCSDCRHHPDLDKVCDICFRNPNLRDSWDKTGE